MKKLRIAILIAALSTTATAPIACTHPTPTSVQTPQGKVAYQVEDAVDAINLLRHETIAARRANLIQTNSMRIVVKAANAADTTLDAAIDNGTGTAAVFRDAAAALTSARGLLPKADADRLGSYFDAAVAVLNILATR